MAHTPPPRARQVIQPIAQTQMVSGAAPRDVPTAITAEAPARSQGTMAELGFVRAPQILIPTGRKHRSLMLNIYGPPSSGKSEFAMSGPGPGAHIVLDRNITAPLNNKNPPKTRNPNWMFRTVQVPKSTQFDRAERYLPYWQEFYKVYAAACDASDSRTVVLDGDADSWELQQLAEYGKVTQILPIMRTSANAARRAFYARASDSGKVFISTVRNRKKYFDVRVNGVVQVDGNGQAVREWDGKSYEKAGFNDDGFVFEIILEAMYTDVDITLEDGTFVAAANTYGVRLERCKSNRELENSELWGDDCNLLTLLKYVYPQIPVQEWGF